MRQHAEEVFTARDIELRFTAPSATDSVKLGLDVRRDLLLFFKEIVNNAARHSRCSSVQIDIRLEGSKLIVAMTDNGVGFDTAAESDGQGLMSMRRRAERLKGDLQITSGPGIGTTVKLELPA
jgi:signal transduction histidine kinase